MKEINLDTVVVGSGLSGLSFANEFLKKNKKISIISCVNEKLEAKQKFVDLEKDLPPQIFKKKCIDSVHQFFQYNLLDTCNVDIIGSTKFGGLSNYWANQIDCEVLDDLDVLNSVEKKKIYENLKRICKDNNFIFKFKKNKITNNLKLPKIFDNLFFDNKLLNIQKPTLAIFSKKIKNKSNFYYRPFDAKYLYEKIKENKNLSVYNYFLEKIAYSNGKYKLFCKNQKKSQIFSVKKLILAGGTISTTKLLIDFLDIKKEIAIKHHQRLISCFLLKKKLQSSMSLFNSIIWFRGKNNNNNFIGDLRFGKKKIINAIIRKFSYLSFLKSILFKIKNFMIFTNVFLSSEFSNLFIKREKKKFVIFAKKNKQKKVRHNLLISIKKIYKTLRNQKIIYPFRIIRILRPGNDFHYCGTIQILGKSKLSVNKNCQLKGFNNLYIVDSSVFDFKKNLFPLGLVISNSIRVAQNILKS